VKQQANLLAHFAPILPLKEPIPHLPILLERPREELYCGINQRVIDMLDQVGCKKQGLYFPIAI
jgi:hypothetical protein